MSQSDTNRNLVAALSYFLMFVTGIVILFVERDNKFIRFHAMQSTLIFGAIFIASALVNGLLGFASGFVSVAIWIIAVFIWIISMIKAYQGQIFKWPVFGDLAERYTLAL